MCQNENEKQRIPLKYLKLMKLSVISISAGQHKRTKNVAGIMRIISIIRDSKKRWSTLYYTNILQLR